MKKYIVFILLIIFIFAFASCNTDKKNNTTSQTSDKQIAETTTLSLEEQLSYFINLTSDDIREVDIVYVKPADPVERYYKTFTEKDDINNILTIIKSSNPSNTDTEISTSSGWTLLVRIWLSQKSTDILRPILISPAAYNCIFIDSYNYGVDNNQYIEELISYYKNSSINENLYF